MKFDDVYDFVSQGPNGTRLSKLDLALYYLAEIYDNWREIRICGLGQTPEDTDGNVIPFLESDYKDKIDFTREDILEYLVSVGRELKR